jgi:hypothetical protein
MNREKDLLLRLLKHSYNSSSTGLTFSWHNDVVSITAIDPELAKDLESYLSGYKKLCDIFEV